MLLSGRTGPWRTSGRARRMALAAEVLAQSPAPPKRALQEAHELIGWSHLLLGDAKRAGKRSRRRASTASRTRRWSARCTWRSGT